MAFMGLAAIVPSRLAALALLFSGTSIGVGLLLVRALSQRSGSFADYEDGFLSALLITDPSPALVANSAGKIAFLSETAAESFGAEPGQTLAEALRGKLGQAQAETVLMRMTSEAARLGASRADIETVSGRLRIGVQSLDGGHMLWRFEEFDLADQKAASDYQVPMISMGRGQAILYMNAAARKLVGGRPKRLDDLFVLPPDQVEGLVQVRTPDGPVQRRLVTISGSAEDRRELLLLAAEESASQGPSSPEQDPDDIWTRTDDLPVPILRLSVAGEIELANAAARQLLDLDPHSPAELSDLMEGLGRSITGWLEEAATCPVDTGSKPHSEFLRLSRSEREVYVQVAVKPIRFQGRTALIAVMSDATELKTLEAQFVQSQKMQAIGQLAGGVAHDFNNLLTAITGHCDLLLLRHDHGDPDYGDLVQINQNANRAAALVGQLLAFSRKQTLRPETIDLRTTLSDLTHLLNRLVGEKVTLTLTHDPHLPKIRADKRQLEQVLMNLVVNARDAQRSGGDIRITTETLHLHQEMQRDRAKVPPGDYVLVKVADTGVGIPPDKLQKVFEPFFTTKRVGEGTGLGLSTAYGIVKQSGGFIFVESTMGEGTCFSLLFPAQRDDPVQLEAPAPLIEQAPETRGDGVVLLVEDEAPVRAFASRALRLRGYTVLEAENAEQALETLRNSKMRIDVFVTDVVMPGMDGPTWVREALKDHPDTRVVFVSGYAEDSFTDASARIPNAVFLPKPFSLADLTDTVWRQLN
ncbi:response regulator [Pseudooceanicola sp. HF7]|nr:ATP-binding protein [Pseudooceanicola sp. HF7]NIZ08825.1 response regulator [Pseudooceanicola sp. HF7]